MLRQENKTYIHYIQTLILGGGVFQLNSLFYS